PWRLGFSRLGPSLGLRGALRARRSFYRPGDRRGLRRPRFAGRRSGVTGTWTATTSRGRLGYPGSLDRAAPTFTGAVRLRWALGFHEPPFLAASDFDCNRWMARNRTAALRGFWSTSVSSARSAPRVSSVNCGACPGNSTGRPDGVLEVVASAKVRLTIRSSSDW